MSYLVINKNQAASAIARNLSTHYNNLQISAERLSTGLRINNAGDDAAGLAIRELQAANIAALKQGARNANDAISMIQIFDGALSVIDEKLIRLKELAEQATTGTYDSTQRQLIDDEFQAMKDEIDRIARATGFNGIKLINGEFEASGTEVTGPDGKTYDLTLAGSNVNVWNSASATQKGGWSTAQITNPGALIINGKTADLDITITNDNIMQIDGKYFMVDAVNTSSNIPAGTTLNIQYLGTAPDPWGGPTLYGFSINNQRVTTSNPTLLTWTDNSVNPALTLNASLTDKNGNPLDFSTLTAGSAGTVTIKDGPSFTASQGTVTSVMNGNTLEMTLDLGDGNQIFQSWDVTNGENRAVSSVSIQLNVTDTTPTADDPDNPDEIPDDIVKIHFGSLNDSAEDYYYINKADATVEGLGLANTSVKTQAVAQSALTEINRAIAEKDKIRSYYGAMQNRLENTITSIKLQAENLCVSEARISDVDVATEMTRFVRSRVLTQSAVAMLGQANLMPRVMLRLIGD